MHLEQDDAGGIIIGARDGSKGNKCNAHTYFSRLSRDGKANFEKEFKYPNSSMKSFRTIYPSGIPYNVFIYNLDNSTQLETYLNKSSGVNRGNWVRRW